jgi:hypothetical protein
MMNQDTFKRSMVAQNARWTVGTGERFDVGGETLGQSWPPMRGTSHRGLANLFEAIDALIDLPWGDRGVHDAIAQVAVERMRLEHA